MFVSLPLRSAQGCKASLSQSKIATRFAKGSTLMDQRLCLWNPPGGKAPWTQICQSPFPRDRVQQSGRFGHAKTALACKLRRNGGSQKSFTRFFSKNRGSGEGRALSQAFACCTSEAVHSFSASNKVCAARKTYSNITFQQPEAGHFHPALFSICRERGYFPAFSSAFLSEAAMKLLKSGWARLGRLLNSGWYCTP